MNIEAIAFISSTLIILLTVGVCFLCRICNALENLVLKAENFRYMTQYLENLGGSFRDWVNILRETNKTRREELEARKNAGR